MDERIDAALGVNRPARVATTWGIALVLWVATRAGYVLVSYLATALHLYQAPANFAGPLTAWMRWDTNWYLIVSRVGYTTPVAGEFFPLYPASVGAVSWILGDGSGPVFPAPDRVRLGVALGLSNLALLAAVYAIARLALLDRPTDSGAGVRSMVVMLAYPLAVAWTAAYSESYFLALAAFTLLFARQGRWYAAAGTAFLLGLTRPLAPIVVLPLLWEWGRQVGWASVLSRDRLRDWARGVVAVAAVPAGMLVFFVYCWRQFGDFLLPMHTAFKYWHKVTEPPWWTLPVAVQRLVHDPGNTNLLGFELGLLAVVVILTVVSIRKMPVAYTLYTAGLLALTLWTVVPSQRDLLWGTARYLGMAIPIYLLLARWGDRREWLTPSIAAVGFLVQGVLTVALFQMKPV
ncbi:MAG: hypothetical protein J2P57_01700, partial [Acidimicrobiaceae bacterium]|nr:hypothetical protein [Acidimicrobiaceae bacterium]